MQLALRNIWAAAAAPGCWAPIDVNCSEPIVTRSAGFEVKTGRVSAPASGDGASSLSEVVAADRRLDTLDLRKGSSLEKPVDAVDNAEVLRRGGDGCVCVPRVGEVGYGEPHDVRGETGGGDSVAVLWPGGLGYSSGETRDS